MPKPSPLTRGAIEARTARLAVIGLGFVGTPVACRFAEAGFDVTGVDVAPEKVARINAGEAPFEGREPGLAELLAAVVRAGRLRATADYAACLDADVFVVAVETPVDPVNHRPEYAALRSALAALGPRLRRGCLVIIESTLAPGTMRGVVAPAVEAASGLAVGPDLHLVHCPERVMPGRLLANLRGMSRVVGGMTPEAGALAATLYRQVVEAELDVTDALTAELVKTAENAYRDVQIAFANELALVCEDLGADVWRVRELVNKSPGRSVLHPGAGVGGHCIPKDPWLLVANAGAGVTPRVIPAARAVNDGMPAHVADLVERALADAGVTLGDPGAALAGARVAVLGYAYLEESDDTRNSPSAALVDVLRARGAGVAIHDPWVPAYRGDVLQVAAGCDATVVMVAHRAYRDLDLAALARVMRTPVVVDGRRAVDAAAARAAGLRYAAVGVG